MLFLSMFYWMLKLARFPSTLTEDFLFSWREMPSSDLLLAADVAFEMGSMLLFGSLKWGSLMWGSSFSWSSGFKCGTEALTCYPCIYRASLSGITISTCFSCRDFSSFSHLMVATEFILEVSRLNLLAF